MQTTHSYRGNAALTAVEGGGDAIRVLVCNDSPTHAAGLARCLERGSGIRVAAVHGRVERALAAIPDLRPDLVLLDLELPHMNGAGVVARLVEEHRLPVVVFSSRTRRGAEAAANARAAGAAAAYTRDDLDLGDPDGLPALVFRRRMQTLAGGSRPVAPALRLA